MSEQIISVLLALCVAILAISAVLTLWRMEKGPTMFDRVLSLDVSTVVVLGAMALITASTGRSDLVSLLAVLAVVGFVGSVAMARFAAAENPEEARILTAAEAQRRAAEELDDSAAPLHDPDAGTRYAGGAGGQTPPPDQNVQEGKP